MFERIPIRAGTLCVCCVLASHSVQAADPGAGAARPAAPPVTVSAAVTLVSDYRFRGISVSGKDPALQGEMTLDGAYGHLGVWGSSIESFNGAELELDVTAGRSFTLFGLDNDAGLVAYVFPGGSETDYIEVYARTGGELGVLGWSAGINYAPDQRNIGGTDSVYGHLDLSLPLARPALRLDAGVGFEDGAFGDNKWDWHLGLAHTVHGFDISLSYVDARDDVRAISGTAVFTISRGF